MSTYKSGFNTVTVDTQNGNIHIENHKPKERKGKYVIPIGAISRLSKNILYSPTTVAVVIHPINDVRHPSSLLVKADRYAMFMSRGDAKKFRAEIEEAMPQFAGSAPDWKPFPQHEDVDQMTGFKGEIKEAVNDALDESIASSKALSGMEGKGESPAGQSTFGKMVDAMEAFEPTLRFGSVKMKGRTVTYKGDEYDLKGARALVDSGQLGKRMTATRVIGGGVIFGPVGALIGGMAKKSTGDAFLNIELADGRLIIEPVKKKQIKEANKFAQKINDTALRI